MDLSVAFIQTSRGSVNVYTLGKCHFVKPRRNWCNLFIIIQFVSHKYIMVDKSIWGAASHACVVVHVLHPCNEG
jgi:hypothetical protein